MSRSPRLVVESHPNQDCRTYHANTAVSNTKYSELFGRSDSLDALLGHEPLDDKCKSFVDKLHDIEPVILESVKEHLDWSDQEVDVRTNGSSSGRHAYDLPPATENLEPPMDDSLDVEGDFINDTEENVSAS